VIATARHSGESRDRMPPARCLRDAVPAFAAMTMWVLVSCLALPAAAQDSLPPAPYAYQQLEDPALEARAQALMETLRCLKCQSQSIADSDAPMAGDMRHQVRTRIAAGEDPEAIRAWLIERYGDYVSYKPTVSATTWPLFAVPAVLVLLALLILRRRLRRAR
jgi:cytochrome c-type biogenesis protein CcmH/NrfF